MNVLLALAWPNHQFHGKARERMAAVQHWASCALTQMAFLRLYLNPSAVGEARPVEEAWATLDTMLQDPRHRYWIDMPSIETIRQEGAFERVLGHRQINDAYLLELARRRGGRLLTFDQRLAALGAPGAAEVLLP